MRGPTVSVNLSYATSQLKPFLCWFSRLHREPRGLAQSGLGDSTSLSCHTPLILSRTLLIILNAFRLQAGQDNPLTHSGWGQSIQTKTMHKTILMGGGFEGVNARMPGVKITDSSLKCKKNGDRTRLRDSCFFELRLQESSHGFLDASGQVWKLIPSRDFTERETVSNAGLKTVKSSASCRMARMF